MVTQIKSVGSPATEFALTPLATAKPRLDQESSRSTKAADTQPAGVEGRPVSASGKELDSAVKDISTHLSQSGSKLEIQYDKTSGRNVIQIVDSGTGGVVLQIPSAEVLAMARKLHKTADSRDTSGILVDKEG